MKIKGKNLLMNVDIAILGGGAAGFFAAIRAKESFPNKRVIIVEKSNLVLSKVRISGGGRCNVTNGCTDPLLLSKNYPRGAKELIGPFHRFSSKDTMEWFESRGVPLKTESDGRVFPKSNSSQCIIDCLIKETKERGVDVLLKKRIEGILKEGETFILAGSPEIRTKKLILATGSGRQGHTWAEELGHSIETQVPSLFTFNVPSSPYLSLSGITFENIKISVQGTKLSQEGALLLTHFGFSGPAPLKLSSWAARVFFEKKYQLPIEINWIPTRREPFKELVLLKKKFPERTLFTENPFALPKKFWRIFVGHSKRFNDVSHKELEQISLRLTSDVHQVEGKTVNKEEFVTCGGIRRNEVDFKTMESKICSNLFFAGEILDIDAMTGGFNFQNAWTTGFIAGS